MLRSACLCVLLSVADGCLGSGGGGSGSGGGGGGGRVSCTLKKNHCIISLVSASFQTDLL